MENFLDEEPDPPPILVKPTRFTAKKVSELHMYAHELYYNNGKNGPVQHIMMKLGCAALTDPKNCPYFQHTLMAIIWSNTFVRSEELQERGQNAQQLWYTDLMDMTFKFPDGADRNINKWYLPVAPGKPVILWCVANQDKDHSFSMHEELIKQTHDIEGSLDFHVFGGVNSHAAAPTEGRVVHVHHDMIWLNEAQFQGLKYVAKHYFIHPRPGHPLISDIPAVVDAGPTEEELINFIANKPTFEKATTEHEPEPYSLNHSLSCTCSACNPLVLMTVDVPVAADVPVFVDVLPVSNVLDNNVPTVAEASIVADVTNVSDVPVVDVLPVVESKKSRKRHFTASVDEI